MDKPPPLDPSRTITLAEARAEQPGAPDARTDLRDINGIINRTLRAAAHAADPYRGKKDAKAVMRLRDAEAQTIGRLRRGEATIDEREAYIQSPDNLNQRRLKALYLKLGLARMLTLGDWSVGRREKEISEGLGVVPLDEVEALLLNYYLENGFMATDAPIKEGKFIHLHAGGGNGVMMEHLRRSRRDPFGNGHRLINYFGEVGLADCIYFTLNDLLYSFVKEEHQNDPALKEFIDIVSTLLLRKIHFGQDHKPKDSTPGAERVESEFLMKLPADPNQLRLILPLLSRYITNFAHLRRIKGDGEFLGDQELIISPECKDLITEYLEGVAKDPDSLYFANAEANERARAGERVSGPTGFLAKYFKPELMDEGTNLAEHITIHTHNVVPGRFQDVAGIFSPKPTFDLVHGFRSTSHLENADYENFLREVCLRLKPGGVILDDGWRESYTRDQRVPEWVKLAKELGPDFKVEVVLEGNTPKSMLVQRAIQKENGVSSTFSPTEKRKLLLPGHRTVPIDEFWSELPLQQVRTATIHQLKRVLVGASFEEADTPDMHWQKVFHGRLRFTGLHPHINDAVDQVTQGEVSEEVDPRDPQLRGLVASIIRQIRLNEETMPEGKRPVTRRMELAKQGALPVRGGDFSTYTFPLHHASTGEGIHKQRIVPIKELPRNTELPTSLDLAGERDELVAALFDLRKLLDKAPLTLLEFDNCFTNPMMRDTLERILGVESLRRLLRVENVRLRERRYPKVEPGIYIVGGSENHAFDEHGEAFTEGFGVPLVESIAAGEPVRAKWTCFGHQTGLGAYGRVKGLPFNTERGALQFGATHVNFNRDVQHAVIRPFWQKRHVTVAMTRSGYTHVPGYEEVPDMVPLAFECDGFLPGGTRGISNHTVPPVAFALLDGKVITTQFHPDIQLSDPRHTAMLRTYLQRYDAQIREEFKVAGPTRDLDSPQGIYNHNVALEAKSLSGQKTSWVARDVGPALFISTFRHHASSLLEQLRHDA